MHAGKGEVEGVEQIGGGVARLMDDGALGRTIGVIGSDDVARYLGKSPALVLYGDDVLRHRVKPGAVLGRVLGSNQPGERQ